MIITEEENEQGERRQTVKQEEHITSRDTYWLRAREYSSRETYRILSHGIEVKAMALSKAFMLVLSPFPPMQQGDNKQQQQANGYEHNQALDDELVGCNVEPREPTGVTQCWRDDQETRVGHQLLQRRLLR